MNAAATTIKRRARRIAADEAHSWARNLRLKNPYAKLVLCMITQYVQGDGTCFVGIKALAEDCELAEETIRRRLSWLETVGAIVRLPQWVDEYGRRNSEERGRRTTDEIRLLFDADIDLIEGRAAGDIEPEADAEQSAVTLSRARGSNPPQPSADQPSVNGISDTEKTFSPPVSPLATPSLRTGPESFEPEPEPEIDPPTPQRGVAVDQSDQENETKGWQHTETWERFERAWQEPILHQQLCRQIWSAFNDGERETAVKVARGYVKWRQSQKRPPNTCNAQKILRERDAWPRFVELAGPDPALRTFIVENSPEFHALAVLEKIGGFEPWPLILNPATGERGYWRSQPVPVDLIGLAVFAQTPVEQWTQLELNTPSFFAWSSRVFEWIGKRRTISRVPCSFPPRKDGSIAPSSIPLATQDDLNHFGKTG